MSRREILLTALEVMAGLWSNGATRWRLLVKEFGEEDARQVQKAVNNLAGMFGRRIF